MDFLSGYILLFLWLFLIIIVVVVIAVILSAIPKSGSVGNTYSPRNNYGIQSFTRSGVPVRSIREKRIAIFLTAIISDIFMNTIQSRKPPDLTFSCQISIFMSSTGA